MDGRKDVQRVVHRALSDRLELRAIAIPCDRVANSFDAQHGCRREVAFIFVSLITVVMNVQLATRAAREAVRDGGVIVAAVAVTAARSRDIRFPRAPIGRRRLKADVHVVARTGAPELDRTKPAGCRNLVRRRVGEGGAGPRPRP